MRMIGDKRKYLLGIDLGASFLRFVLGEQSAGNIKLLKQSKKFFESPLCKKDGIFHESSYANIPNNKIVAAFVEQKLFEYLKMVCVVKTNIIGVGISVAGKIQKDRRFIGSNVPLEYAENLCGEYGIDLISPLKEIFRNDEVNINIENDAKSAALAQGVYYKSKGLEPNKTFFITVSTGIGGGGLKKDLDEVGHIIVNGYFPGLIPICGCGAAGCIEAYASGEGIKNQAMKILQMFFLDKNNFEKFHCFENIRANEQYDLKQIVKRSKLAQDYKRNVSIDAEGIFELSGISGTKKGIDEFAYYLIDMAAERLAKTLVSISNIHGIERFGLGGSVVINNPEYANVIQNKISLIYEDRKDIYKKALIVEVTPLREHITDFGALCLALSSYVDKHSDSYRNIFQSELILTVE